MGPDARISHKGGGSTIWHAYCTIKSVANENKDYHHVPSLEGGFKGAFIMLNTGDKRHVVRATEYLPGGAPQRMRKQFSDLSAARKLAKELKAKPYPVEVYIITESIEERHANFK